MHQTISGTQPRTREIVTASMFAALILLATSVLKIQTPTFGYIHIGDAFVLLAGFLLGPVTGGLAAGIGSALSDLFGGYVLWVPGTFLIKFLTAAAAAQVLQFLQNLPASHRSGRHMASDSEPAAGTGRSVPARKSGLTQPHTGSGSMFAAVITAGIAGEILMVIGYFFCNIIVVSITNGGFTRAGIAAAAALAAAGLPFNAVQGAAGIVLATPLYSIFRRIVSR
ncbi:MAG: ECF transporter S component [Eubacterium sp.]|nr:ECF transporter S component [Eubacterium sp.]